MAQISKEDFLSLSNEQVWTLFQKNFHEREKYRDTLSQINIKMDFLISKIQKLEDEIAVSKSVNTALKKECVNLRRKCNRDSQYHRQENVEFTGIPDNISDNNLEKTVISLLKITEVNVTPNDIVDCHRLPRRKTVIVRFLNCKHSLKALLNGKRLKGNTGDICGNSAVYINRNLIPEYLSLRWKAKKMKSQNLVHDFGTNRRGIWVKETAEGDKRQIEIDDDLFQYLPEGKTLNDICY